MSQTNGRRRLLYDQEEHNLEWSENVDPVCAVASLIAAIAVALLQLWQAKRVKDFEHRQDERGERRHAKGNRARAGRVRLAALR